MSQQAEKGIALIPVGSVALAQCGGEALLSSRNVGLNPDLHYKLLSMEKLPYNPQGRSHTTRNLGVKVLLLLALFRSEDKH